MNWYEVVTYLVLFLMFLAGIRVVTTSNVIHAAISLVLALALSAALFLLLSADFVAWVLVLVYIGAVIVLFLFGIMIADTAHIYSINCCRNGAMRCNILSVY